MAEKAAVGDSPQKASVEAFNGKRECEKNPPFGPEMEKNVL